MMLSTNATILNSSLQQDKSSLLLDEEEKILNSNDKLLLPSSTRSIKRRTSLLEKSRDWARRLITLHRTSRRNTIGNEKIHQDLNEFKSKSELKEKHTSQPLLHNSEKNFDEDGYLSPMEIKTKIDNRTHENINHTMNMNSSLVNSEYLHSNSSNRSPVNCHINQQNISKSFSKCLCQQKKRQPITSFVTEFQKSLPVVDYIDIDMPDELIRQNIDEPVESLKYLFDEKRNMKERYQNFRRISRRSTNASSISTDSGYSDMPMASTKMIPVNLISCRLIPVNLAERHSINIHSMASKCPLASHIKETNNNTINSYSSSNKSYSTMTIYPYVSGSTIKPIKSISKINDHNDEYNYKQQLKKHSNRQQANLMRTPTINDDLARLSRWYKPYLQRESVSDVLQNADYGAFVLRNSITHPNCFALSIKVPKFTHGSNIVHYLIEKIMINHRLHYRIKGTMKQFPTLLSLLTHHSVMPEILPITLNMDESIIV